MSSTLVRGNNFALVYDGKPFGCGRSISIEEDVETVGTSSKGTGKWAEFIPVSIGWAANGESLLIINSTNAHTFGSIRDIKNAGSTIVLAVSVTDILGNVYTVYGRAFFQNLSSNGTVNNVASFSFKLQGVGELAQYPAPYNLFADTEGPDGANTTFTFSWELLTTPTTTYLEYSSDSIAPTVIDAGTGLISDFTIATADADGLRIRIRAFYGGTNYSNWSEYFNL